jgi:hypothetical protein
MPRLFCSVFFVLVSLPVLAADQPRPNTLTPQEVADGWILLFDGETTTGWVTDGQATVKDGILVFTGAKLTTIHPTTIFKKYSLHIEVSQDPRKWAIVHLDAAEFQDQRIGNFPIRVPPGGPFFLRNVKIRPLGLVSLFNGKDLTGWKEFKGNRYKSLFTVTKEGWLHISNGPGDLQTEGQWDNFILQIDCFTNGPRLNSGVFFRCLPNEYQQGYEAQIHNAFNDEKPKDYTIDEYDPKTGKQTGKRTVRLPAQDYGTGGIYRRFPARKQAAKDQEWFTMTVAAHGRHIATWVNGIQVVDWTDNRSRENNARKGCRLEKGAISLQGHDPTTDLSFRNIRIGELPPK